MQNANLSAIVAQLNAAKNKPAEAKQEPKKPATKRSQATAGAKSRTKAAAEAPPARPPAPAAAAALLAASAPGATPHDPTTAALSKRVKDVLDCLQQRNGSQLTPAQLREITGLNVETDLPLLRELHRHPRITYKGAPHGHAGPAASAPSTAAEWYTYHPEIPGITNKHGLLTYVRDNKGKAVPAEALRQCYLRAPEDLKELRREGLIFIVGHPDAEKETVFVRDMLGQEGIQDDVRTLWFDVCEEHVKDHVPRGMQELQTAVVKAGLRSALANQPVKRMLPGAKRERAKKPRAQRFNIDKATNAHLPSLFSGAQPKNIDT